MNIRSLAVACGMTAAAAGLGLAAADSFAQAPAPITVKVIGFNDFHGNLQSAGVFGVKTTQPFAQRPAVGGSQDIDALTAYLAGYKAPASAYDPTLSALALPRITEQP